MNNNTQSNPFKPPLSTASGSSREAINVSPASIANGILACVITWAPASVLSLLATIFGAQWYDPEFIFYGAIVLLFWMCVIGTGLALLTGYLLFFPIAVWSYRRGISPLLFNIALALLLAWSMPTVVLSIMSGDWQTAHGFAPWCVAPAITCCLVFHFHQRRARRLASDVPVNYDGDMSRSSPPP